MITYILYKLKILDFNDPNDVFISMFTLVSDLTLVALLVLYIIIKPE